MCKQGTDHCHSQYIYEYTRDIQSNLLNGSPGNCSIFLLVQYLTGPILYYCIVKNMSLNSSIVKEQNNRLMLLNCYLGVAKRCFHGTVGMKRKLRSKRSS